MDKQLAEAFEIREGILTAYHLREETVRVPEGVRIIGAGAFKGCTSIKKILLPESVEAIGEHAFKGCRQLEEVYFPKKLKSIGAYAFHRCHHLKEIRLPESVSELSDCAFLYCDGLESASIAGVLKMGRQAFVNATNLKKLIISSELLPECINDTFTGCTRISEITILDKSSERTYRTDHLIEVMEADETMPEMIRAIAADIYHMMDIENGVLQEFHVEPREVEVPEGIREIGKSCFFDKRGILEIYLPASLEKIGERAFRNCINLEHILLKNPNTKISKDAFKNCTTLKRVTLNGTTYSLVGLPNGEENRQMPRLVHQIHTQLLENFCISGTVLLRYWGSEARVTVPDGITVIGERAFAGNEAVGKLILPESVVEIQQEAFADCVVLQTLNFPKGLERIGAAAFEGCVKLLRAEIPAGVSCLPSSVFSRCKKLGQITFEGNRLRELGQQAFYGCQNLSFLTFPDSLEKIGALAFYQCHSLRQIVLPKAVASVGAEAFACCRELREVVIEGNLVECGRNIFAYAEKLRKLSFLGEQRKIPEYFTWKCTSLKQVIVSDCLENVGLAAFEGTTFLKELTESDLTDSILLDGKTMEGEVKIPEGITAIAGGAFYGNDKITSVRLPHSLKFLGEKAFCSCTQLKEVILPEKVTVISEGAFAYCSQLERIASEGEIKAVGEKAFYQCYALKEIPPLYDAEIGDDAFAECRELQKVRLVRPHLGAYSFENTGFLKDRQKAGWVIFESGNRKRLEYRTVAVIGDTIADGSEAVGEVTLPAGSCAIAPYAFFGNDRVTRVILPEGLKEIGAFAFCGCTKLCEVFIPDSVEVIGNSAFEKCSQLLTVSSAAKRIGERAFAFCSTLRFVFLFQVKEFWKETFLGCCLLQTVEAERIKQVGVGCFKGCVGLKCMPVTGLEEIREEAFANCEGMQAVSFSSGVRIGAKAFLDCCGLTQISFADNFAGFDCSAFWGSTFLKEVRIADRTYPILGYEDLFRYELPEFVRQVYASTVGCFFFRDTGTIAGYRTDARAVCIPNGIYAIEGEVFKDCIRLEHVEIPESVTYIGERAFWGSGWLKRKKEEETLVIRNHILLDGASASGDVVIPEDVHMISGWAFANCYGLRELTVLNRRLVIEPHTFRNCIYLKGVTIEGVRYELEGLSVRKDENLPPVVREIFEDALNCYKTDEAGVLIECTGNITNFALVKGITAIGDGVFQESNLLTYAALTKDVERIGERAFARCKWLASVSHTEGLKEIGAMAFSGCIRLEMMEFSDSLRVIEKQAFENCTLLQEVVLPEGIREVPKRAFFRCRSLRWLVLPDSLERIGEEAFAFCDSLQEVVLPEGLQKIDERGFAWCRKLRNPEIPSRAEIAENAFEFSGVTLFSQSARPKER